MTTTTKTVGISYKVDVKQLTAAEKETQRYLTTLKKIGQTTRQVAKVNQQLDRSYRGMVTGLQALVQGQVDAARATQQQTNAAFQQQDAIYNQLSLIQQHLAAVQQSSQTVQQNTQTVQQNTQAQATNSRAVRKNSASWVGLAKKMLLWGIGAASAYRLFMKVRRAIAETIETLFENTEEYKRLQKAQDRVKVSLIALLGSEEDWLESIDNVAAALEKFSDAITDIGADIAALDVLFRRFTDTSKAVADAIRLATGQVTIQGLVAETTTGMVEAHNKALEDAADLQVRFAKEAREGGKKAADAWADPEAAAKRYHQYLEKLQEAEKDRVLDLIDLYAEYARKLQDIETDVQRDLQDLATKGARRREDIETAYRRKLEDIEGRAADNRARAEARYRRRLIQIEMRYREQLIRIEENFADAMYDAIAKRDATAALKAIRTRTRDIGRAERQRDDARTLAKLDYDMQIADQERALARMREDARKARDRALQDLALYLERERQDIALSKERELEDLRLYRTRKEHDIEEEYRRATAAADAWYKREEIALKAHLTRNLAYWRNYYAQVARMAQGVHTTLPKVGAGTRPSTGGAGPVPKITGAQGGAWLLTQRTQATFAEKGPEIVFAQPLSAPTSGTMSGSFSMRHSVQGQVQAVMTGLEGRLSHAVAQAVVEAMGAVLAA